MSLENALKLLLAKNANGREARMRFYQNPVAYLDLYVPGTTQQEKALLFSMNRRLIAGRAPNHGVAVEAHEFSGHWRAQGQDWPGGTAPASGWYDPNSVKWGKKDTDSPPLMTLAGGGGGSAWADPGPHGRGFDPQTWQASSGLTTIRLVGEGFLDKATVVMEHIEWTRPNAGPYDLPVIQANYQNFRRSYLECELDIRGNWPTGLYTITVQNDPANPETHIKAGQFFRVT